MTKLPPVGLPILPRRFKRPGVKLAAAFLVILLLGGCGKPPMLVHKYILEYPSPVVRASQPLDETIKVDKFAVAQAFNTTSMMYRTHPYKSEAYTYSRWRVNPGYLVTDYLRRDLRNSRLFKAVLPTDSPMKSRFLLEGGVEEIQEIDEGDVWKASLALTITLLDVNQSDITRRVVFQNHYRTLEPITDKTPGGLAQALSRAMENLSAQIIEDVYRAAKRAGK